MSLKTLGLAWPSARRARFATTAPRRAPARRPVRADRSPSSVTSSGPIFLSDEESELLDHDRWDPGDTTRVPVSFGENVRGSLLPVTDLHGFAHSGRASNARNSRLLVYNKDGIRAGVRVDDVLGLRQFPLEESGHEQTTVHESLQPYIERTFRQGEQVWPVFSLALFADSRAFLQIGKTSGPAVEAVAS